MMMMMMMMMMVMMMMMMMMIDEDDDDDDDDSNDNNNHSDDENDDENDNKVMMIIFILFALPRIICLSSSPNGLSFTSSASSGIRKRAESNTFTSQKKNTQLKQLQSMTDSNRPSSEGTIFDWDMKTFKIKVNEAHFSTIFCVFYVAYIFSLIFSFNTRFSLTATSFTCLGSLSHQTYICPSLINQTLGSLVF